MLRLRPRPFFIIGMALMAELMVGCGAHRSGGVAVDGGVAVNPIGGTMNVERFIIPAGQTQTATSDLTVNATAEIIIDGTLLVLPGVSLALLADGPLTINGTIQPIGQQAQIVLQPGSTRRQIEPRNESFFSGSDVVVAEGGVVENTGDSDLNFAPKDGSGSVRIEGRVGAGGVRGRDGMPGSPAGNGEDGGDVNIGNDAALQGLRALGRPTAQPRTVRVSGRVNAAGGGLGGRDEHGPCSLISASR